MAGCARKPAAPPAKTYDLSPAANARFLAAYAARRDAHKPADGRLYRGKTGVARMAVEGGVPVIPCAMIGFSEMQPAGTVIPKRVPVTVRIGKPLDFSRYDGLQADRFVLRSITDEIMYELMELSGQEYGAVYAAKAKPDLAAATVPEEASDKPTFALGDEPTSLAS